MAFMSSKFGGYFADFQTLKSCEFFHIQPLLEERASNILSEFLAQWTYKETYGAMELKD